METSPAPGLPPIFISHSSKDDAEVSRLAAKLREAGFQVWVDHEEGGIEIGSQSFDQDVQDALNAARYGLFVLTGDAAKSKECNGEWRHLLSHKRLFVARLTDFPSHEFPSRLAIIQYANLLRDYDQGLDALIKALRKHADALDPTHPGTALALRRSGQFPDAKLSLPLIGRGPDLATVGQLLGGAGAVVLTGPGGVGKTRLAAELAALAANDDGVIWYTLAPAATEAEADKDLQALTALIREHFPSELAGIFDPDKIWAHLGKSEALLVLDNAEDCQCPQPFIQQLEKLSTNGTKRGVLLTSRYFWPGLTAREHQVPIPTPPDGVRIMQEMLDFWLETHQARPVAAEVAALAAAARYHPRLMEFAAVWRKRYPAVQVETWLRTLRGSKKPEEALADVLGHTLDLVARQPDGPAALAALRRVLPCRGGFSYEAYCALTADQPEAVDALDTLLAWNLLRRDNSERYDIDLLTREVEAPDAAAYPLHYDYYRLLFEQHDEKKGYRGLAPEAGNVEVAFEFAMTVKDPKWAYWLVNVASEMLYNRGHAEQQLTWLQRVESIFPKEGYEEMWALLNISLGRSYLEQPLGNRIENLTLSIAAYQRALYFYNEETSQLDYSLLNNNLCNVYREMSQQVDKEVNLHLAIAASKQALRFYTEEVAPLEYATVQSSLGAAYQELSEVADKRTNLDLAIAAYQQALRFRSGAKTPLKYAATQNNLGNAHLGLSGIVDQEANLILAIIAFKEALIFFTEDAAPMDYAMTHNNLGNVYNNLSEVSNRENNLQLAIKSYQQALRFRTEVAYPLNYAKTQCNLGNAYQNLSEVIDQTTNLRMAISAYEEGRRVAANQHAWWPYALITKNLGCLTETAGDLHRAIEYWQDAERHYRDTLEAV